MRLALRERVAEGVQRALRRAGYELHPWQPGGELDEDDVRRSRLLGHLGITLLLDVGANAGQYAERTRRAGYTGRIVSFEPVAAAYEALAAAAAADRDWQARRLAVGDADGEAEIHVAGNAAASSSLLEMRERHLASAPEAAYVASERVPTVRLDSTWDQLVTNGDRVWLKLDVQGFERQAIEGAGDRLDEVAAVQTELSLVPLYEGAAGWREIVDLLSARGFELAGIQTGFEDVRTGRTLQVDGIFVRT